MIRRKWYDFVEWFTGVSPYADDVTCCCGEHDPDPHPAGSFRFWHPSQIPRALI